jgi:hypothetical protein
MRILDSMMDWVEEVPPLPQENQRFGNLAFRKYIKLVEEVCICGSGTVVLVGPPIHLWISVHGVASSTRARTCGSTLAKRTLKPSDSS